MEYELSQHAEEELARRKIPAELLDNVMQNPEQIVPEHDEIVAYQSKVAFPHGKLYLLRVMVNEQTMPVTIVTVYRTSKIDKYWNP